jgi:hypothetical protein
MRPIPATHALQCVMTVRQSTAYRETYRPVRPGPERVGGGKDLTVKTWGAGAGEAHCTMLEMGWWPGNRWGEGIYHATVSLVGSAIRWNMAWGHIAEGSPRDNGIAYQDSRGSGTAGPCSGQYGACQSHRDQMQSQPKGLWPPHLVIGEIWGVQVEDNLVLLARWLYCSLKQDLLFRVLCVVMTATEQHQSRFTLVSKCFHSFCHVGFSCRVRWQ